VSQYIFAALFVTADWNLLTALGNLCGVIYFLTFYFTLTFLAMKRFWLSIKSFAIV
jgi:hypothetical protein